MLVRLRDLRKRRPRDFRGLRQLALLSAFALVAATVSSACSRETTSASSVISYRAGISTADASCPAPAPKPGCIADPGAPTPTFDATATDDPVGGAAKFTLRDALAGFPECDGKLTAIITTEKSAITCTLDEAAAPVSVANFVGLARGTRPYRITDRWQVGHFYDGLTWHRVVPGFVIQGGDPAGDGQGGPGYDLIDENHVDEPLGTLAMAAASSPSGSQLYIVVGNGPPPSYNVFGSCTTEAAVAIASVPRDGDDKPKTPVHLLKVDIARCP